MDLPFLLRRARASSLWRIVLNRLLPWKIPFNAPHGFEAIPMRDGGIKVKIPFWRVNRNHIRGIHACAMATAAEMCSGLAIMEHLDPKEYRLIMRSLKMEYHFQAKRSAFAICVPPIGAIEQQVILPLRTHPSIEMESTVRVEDSDGQHLANGTIVWQVKEWGQVRTKL